MTQGLSRYNVHAQISAREAEYLRVGWYILGIYGWPANSQEHSIYHKQPALTVYTLNSPP